MFTKLSYEDRSEYGNAAFLRLSLNLLALNIPSIFDRSDLKIVPKFVLKFRNVTSSQVLHGLSSFLQTSHLT